MSPPLRAARRLRGARTVSDSVQRRAGLGSSAATLAFGVPPSTRRRHVVTPPRERLRSRGVPCPTSPSTSYRTDMRILILNSSPDTCDVLEEYFRQNGWETAALALRRVRDGTA